MLDRRRDPAKRKRRRDALAELVGRESLYAFLAAEGGNLFRDEDLGEPEAGSGARPSVLAAALVLQAYEGVDDAEAERRAGHDLRWKVALGVGLDERPFSEDALRLFRARALLDDEARAMLCRSLEAARASDAVRARADLRAAVAPEAILGAAAARDACALLAERIARLTEAVAEAVGCAPADWAQDHGVGACLDEDFLDEAEVDWDDDASRRGLLAEVASGAERALACARRAVAESPEGAERIGRAAEPLEALVSRRTAHGRAVGKRRPAHARSPRSMALAAVMAVVVLAAAALWLAVSPGRDVQADRAGVVALREAVRTSPYAGMGAAPLLEAFLGAEGEAARLACAAMALRKDESLPAILEALRDGPVLRQHKVTKLVRYLRWREAVPALLEVASSDEAHWVARLGCLHALGATGDASAAPRVAALLDRAGRQTVEVRAMLAVLARLGHRQSIPAIRRYVGHEEPLVRLYAIRALAELGEAPPIEEAMRAARAEDYVVREEACGVLGACGGREARARLDDLAATDPVASVRQEAHLSLFRMDAVALDDGERAALAERVLSDPAPRLRAWALRVLACECGARGREVLSRVMQSPSADSLTVGLYLLAYADAASDRRRGGQ